MAANSLEEFLKERRQQETMRAKPFPLKCLLSLYLKIQYKIPFNDFLLLVRWLSPISTEPDNGAPFFLAFNSFETQQIAAAIGSTNFIVQQTFMELYHESRSRLLT